MGLVRKLLNVFEKVDNKPVALPVGIKLDPEADRMKMLLGRLVKDLEQRGVIPNEVESFEDSLDFALPDDEDGDVVFAAHTGGVSPSEMRYMAEENLLREAHEADSMKAHRDLDAKLKENANERKESKGRRDRVERSGDGDGSDVSGNVVQERRSSNQQAGK